ncbi:uncharacterized protein LOC107605754 [Arachis ipaensis]|uniref:uncharacterized protein LOC107605754 n=1 Tax=Arachis ipaensis TaxID=130454 RepID=UPI0007AF1DC5|nr:uncharacterized protein LOC107605754 [Arachis ipaensis]
MGSLMAGWDSKSATLKRNRSLTKDEIDAYWRTKKKIEEEHLRAISNLAQVVQTSTTSIEVEKKLQRAITMPLGRGNESLNLNIDSNLEELIKKNGWWTKSSWAFLNEPPVTESSSNKYVSQFHVANMGTAHGDGISA